MLSVVPASDSRRVLQLSALLLKQIRDLAVIKRNASLKKMTLKSFIINNNQLFHSHKSLKKSLKLIL